MLNSFGSAHHRHTVAILQQQVFGGQQFYVATHHAAHVHAIGVAQVQCAQHLAVQHRACYHYHPTFHVRVDGVPVNLFAVPVFLHPFAKQYLHGVGLFACGYHQQVIVNVYHRVGQWHYYLFSAPYTRDNEVHVRHLCNVGNGFSAQRRVHGHILRYICVVYLRTDAWLEVRGSHAEAAYQHHANDDAHHTQRISYGTAQGGTAARQSSPLQRLLCGTQCGRVCSGATQYAHHIRHADAEDGAQPYGHDCAQGDDGKAPQV